MSFRRAFGIMLFVAGAALVAASIGLRYAAWDGGALDNALGYWFDITLTESWAWVSMLVIGWCIVAADDFEHDARNRGRGGTIG